MIIVFFVAANRLASFQRGSSNSYDVYPDIGRTGPIEQLFRKWRRHVNAAVRLDIGVTLVQRLSLIIEEGEIHIIFARKFAAAVASESP